MRATDCAPWSFLVLVLRLHPCNAFVTKPAEGVARTFASSVTVPIASDPAHLQLYTRFPSDRSSGLPRSVAPPVAAGFTNIRHSTSTSGARRLGVLQARRNANSNSNSNDTDDDTDSSQWLRQFSSAMPSILMISLPFISYVFPWLVEVARSLPPNSAEQLAVVTALFVGNRAYLYALSTTIVVLAAIRGSGDSTALGQRIQDLTEELLARPTLDAPSVPNQMQSSSSANTEVLQQSPSKSSRAVRALFEDSGIQDSLNSVSSESQALILPLVVTALLASSVFFLQLWDLDAVKPMLDQEDSMMPFGGATEFVTSIKAWLEQNVATISQLWNAALLTMFSRSEIRRLMSELLPSQFIAGNSNRGVEEDIDSFEPVAIAEWSLAVIVTAAAFLAVPSCWQAQNFINMALAILVARSIQLDRFPAVMGALSLLVLYDVASVFWVAPAGAVSLMEQMASTASTATADSAMSIGDAYIPTESAISTAQLLTDPFDGLDPAWSLSDLPSLSLSAAGPGDAKPSSAMASVAMQKLTSSSFQPGLLVTKIESRLGGALGLGDAVFPSLLAIFCRRYDTETWIQRQNEDAGIPSTTGADGADASKPEPSSLFATSIVGYVVGCAACEFAPTISTTGLPALLFIVPSMVGLVVTKAILTGDFGKLWEFRAGSGDGADGTGSAST